MGLYRREEGLCGYTDGLAAFGKEEIEVLDTQAALGDLHSFLLDLASYVLEEDVTFHDGGRPSALPRGSICPSPAAPVSGTTA